MQETVITQTLKLLRHAAIPILNLGAWNPSRLESSKPYFTPGGMSLEREEKRGNKLCEFFSG
jgi:hypothetical protein